MTCLPIIERELRVQSRKGATYWTRFGVALFGVLIGLMQINLSSALGGVAAAGNAAFQALVGAAFAVCCCACLMTADAISSERREGTLGLLFLTHVRGHDVLLGKLASAALAGLCAVLAFLPVLMIPVLSGGVTGGETLRKGLVLLDTLFFALAVGLWVSARGETWMVAIRKAALLMLGILIVPLIYGLLTRDLPPWSHAVAAFSPITGLVDAGDQRYRTAARVDYWASLILVQLLGCALLWRASALLRQSLREPPVEVANPPPSPALADAGLAPSQRRRPLTDETEPIRWLLARQRGLWVAVWVGVLLAVSYRFFAPFLFRFVSPGGTIQGVLWPASLVLNIAKEALFAWVASRFFVESRRTGELELLLTTPCGAATVVAAQWAVLKRLFSWPIVVMVLASLVQGAPILWRWYAGASTPWATAPWGLHYGVSLGIGCISLCVGVLAQCWVAMWCGLKARNQTSAIVWTVGLVTVAPHLVGWGFSLAASGLLWLIPKSASPSLFYLLASWLSNLLVVGFYLWLIYRTKRLLGRDLRDAELQPLALTRGAGEFWRDGVAALRKARHWTPS